MKMPTFTAPTTKVVKRHAKIAVRNGALFYDSSTNAGKGKEEATPSSPLTERYTALSASFKHEERNKSEKKQEASSSS